MSRHHCHALGCTTPTPPRLLCCQRHWAMVPPNLQRAVILAYDPRCARRAPGSRPTREWLAAAALARAAIARAEGNAAGAEYLERIALQSTRTRDGGT